MNKIALITGASSGIGEHIARTLIAQKWCVVGIARNELKLLELQKELGENFIPVVCDVSKLSEIKQVSNNLKHKALQPDLFFLNAGCGEFEEMGIDLLVQEHTFAVNYFGAIAWVEEWLPETLKTGGTFVGISSIVALCPTPQSSAYCASKSALKAAFDSLRVQYCESKVSFITVMPGPIETSMLKSTKPVPFALQPSAAAEYILKQVLTKKREIIIFPLFYKLFFKLLAKLPTRIIKKVL